MENMPVIEPLTLTIRRASPRNHPRYGSFAVLLSCESRDEFAGYSDACFDHFQPAGVFETSLVEELIAARWRLRRLRRIQTALPGRGPVLRRLRDYETRLVEAVQSALAALQRKKIKGCKTNPGRRASRRPAAA